MREVSEEKFIEMRDMLSQSECAFKTVPLSSISISDDSLVNQTIKLAGSRVHVSPQFFKKLAVLLKMSQSLTSEMLKNSDGKLASTIMSGLKDYRGKQGKSDVILVANPHTKEIIDICKPDNFRRMSNESVFDLTSKIMNEHGNLSIETIDFSSDTGKSAINLLSNEEIGFPGAGPDEFFKFGFSIIQSARDTHVEMYNQRLICSNGLRASLGQGAIGSNNAIQFQEAFKLTGSGSVEISQFLNRVKDMAKADFVPSSFQQTLETAANTKASLLEVELAMLNANRMIGCDDPSLKHNYITSMNKNYFQGYGMAINRIAKKGVDIFHLNDNQKQQIKTPMSIWDVVNSMTYLGSNNTGLPINDQHLLKSKAGKLFGKGTTKGYDLQYSKFSEL